MIFTYAPKRKLRQRRFESPLSVSHRSPHFGSRRANLRPVMGPFRSATMARWPTSHSSSRELKSGDPKTAEELLPMVYDELRQLAADKLTRDGVNKPIREGVRSTGTLGKTQVSTHES
jgi:hypothetical protein